MDPLPQGTESPLLPCYFRVKTGAAITRHWKNFEPVILSCEIPDGDFPPEYVSIITVNSFQPSTLLVIQVGVLLIHTLHDNAKGTFPLIDIHNLRW